ncbi:MAG TPA: hypothetical protein ENK18_06815 [Deltaproteobacteria bacterium]|nr:hypothetical protein [Deltaproteobacteria bacterium]
MSRWSILGVIVGLGAGASAGAIADCAYLYDYDEADLSLVSVTLDGIEVADTSVYEGLGVILRAASPYEADLIVTDSDGGVITIEQWEQP